MWGFFTVNTIYLSKSGVPDKIIGIYGCTIIIIGLIYGTYISSYTKHIDFFIRINLLMASIGLALFGLLSWACDGRFALTWHYYLLLTLSYVFIGLGTLGFFNLSFISLCTIANPLDENISCGLANYLSEFFGISATILCNSFGVWG